MDTKRLLGAGAAALTALVLIWDEAPIAYSAGEQPSPRVAYSDHAAPPGPAASPDSDRAHRAGSEVRGDRTDAGKAVENRRSGGTGRDVAH